MEKKTRFRQYVNSSFEDYKNYIDCHDKVTLSLELCFAQLINKCDSLFGLSIITHIYKQWANIPYNSIKYLEAIYYNYSSYHIYQ